MPDTYELAKLFKHFRTTDVTDALDAVGRQDLTLMDERIRPLWQGLRFWGPAVTVRALTANVRALQVPAAVKPERARLVTAANALAAANAKYLGYLSDAAAPYEFVAAMPLLEKFAIAWTGYRAAQDDLSRALEERR
jgi:regulator of RNase E activity RraA